MMDFSDHSSDQDSDQDVIDKVVTACNEEVEKNLIPGLSDFIRIPNTSRNFDDEWETNGLLIKAAEYLVKWASQQSVKGLSLQIIKEKGLTPVIYGHLKADSSVKNPSSVLFYGHLDKQPHMEGWKEGLSPTTPVIKDDKLYGRGASDDGYAFFTAILALKICQQLDMPLPDCHILIESDEESGSRDLPYYLEVLKKEIGVPDYVYCLDSTVRDYKRLWTQTSLRGLVSADLRVEILTEGVHSGDASGVVPDSFRIIRQLLERIEDTKTGRIHEDFQVDIPAERYKEAEEFVAFSGTAHVDKYKWVEGGRPVSKSLLEVWLNRAWRPQLAVIGQEGFPPTTKAGNVLRPFTTVKLSMRLPPTLKPEFAGKRLKEILEADPPYGAKVTVENIKESGAGWALRDKGDVSKRFNELVDTTSNLIFGTGALKAASGGTIPIIKMLDDLFPNSVLWVTGVLGPETNAHGPNECINIPYLKKFLASIVLLTSSIGDISKDEK